MFNLIEIWQLVMTLGVLLVAVIVLAGCYLEKAYKEKFKKLTDYDNKDEHEDFPGI